MNQVWTNLIDNAIDAMEGRPNSVLEIKTRKDREFTVVSITDNGPGIPSELQDRIFHPLVSGREGGSGLGLTLAQTFVQQHEGLLECDTRPGMTDFRMLLPLP